MQELLVKFISQRPFPTERLLAIQDALNPLDVAVGVVTPDTIIKEHGPDYILRNGTTSIWTAHLIEEAILPQAARTARQPLYDMLKAFLAKLDPPTSITIIDPYFLKSRNDPAYVAAIQNVLGPTLQRVQHLIIVRDMTKDTPGALSTITTALLSAHPTLHISNHHSLDFHDRFWIVNGARGIVVGTSLNGIGNRLCLLDYLAREDVANIVQELRNRGLAAPNATRPPLIQRLLACVARLFAP